MPYPTLTEPPTLPRFTARRINVVGTSSVGKTTLAARLAELLNVPHVELDALHWEPNWTEAPTDVLRERVSAAIAGEGWVVDGNYAKVRDLIWARAEAVVWLDLPLRTILSRYLRRTVRRVAGRQELWAENRERLSMHLVSRDSLLWWILSTYRLRRREYPRLLAGRPDLVTVRLRSARATDRWLAGLVPATR
jgi:adenylate kinase family enzyme